MTGHFPPTAFESLGLEGLYQGIKPYTFNFQTGKQDLSYRMKGYLTKASTCFLFVLSLRFRNNKI